MAQVSHNEVCARFDPGPVKEREKKQRRGRKQSGLVAFDDEVRKCETLTNPPAVTEGRVTRVRLRVSPQESVRIEFHRIGVNSRVVQHMPTKHG